MARPVSNGRPIRRVLRALLITAIAVAATGVTWRLHPHELPGGTTPDSEIVLGCAWVGWLAAGYLFLAVAAAAIGQLGPPVGLARLAPPAIRRAVETAVSASIFLALTGTSVAAATPARPAVAGPPLHPAEAALDWPGLALVSQAPPSSATQHRPPLPPGRTVLVHPGDTLWSIAAARLGATASPDQVAASWPQWYAANRDVIGADPSLIHPGEHLVSPPDKPRSPQ